MPNITYVVTVITTSSNLCIVMDIVEENVTLLKELDLILLLCHGGGIVKHVVRKEKIQIYLPIKKEL
jgi:hypothetical protein